MAAAQDSKLKNVLVSEDGSGSSSKEEDVKESGIDLGSISLDKMTLGPKKKLIVLPLGGFLVHRTHRTRRSIIPKNRRPDFSWGNFLIYKRPFCDDFLRFCFERFEVGVWSSARMSNLTGVLNKVMGELKNKLLFAWDQENCSNPEIHSLENKDKPLFFKELRDIWRDGEYNASNTLLIANPENALLNPSNTGIFPQDYDPENKEDCFLGPDGELRVFLDGLAEAEDVQTYVKDHPFGEPAITPSHPDWEKYSIIIRRFEMIKDYKVRSFLDSDLDYDSDEIQMMVFGPLIV